MYDLGHARLGRQLYCMHADCMPFVLHEGMTVAWHSLVCFALSFVPFMYAVHTQGAVVRCLLLMQIGLLYHIDSLIEVRDIAAVSTVEHELL